MPRTLRLVYLPMRGRAEAIRMCLHYYRIQFEDVVLDYDAYAYSKERGEFPFSQLPVLEVDGQCVAQTGSILRYISQLAGKAGHGISGAQADAAFEAAQETAMAQIYTAVNLMEEPLARSTAAKFRAHLPQYLTNWTHALRQGPYFHGSEPGYADFGVFALLDVGMKFVPGMLEGHDALRAWAERLRGLPAVAEYLAQRPPCRDVSKWIH